MKTRAFTLIELLVVVLIIGILASIAVPQYQKAVMKTRLARIKIATNEIRKAIEVYYMQTGQLPTKLSDLDFTNGVELESEDSGTGFSITTNSGDTCRILGPTFYQCYCVIGNSDVQIMYLRNYKSWFTDQVDIQECRAYSLDTTDIYNRTCQNDTGKTAPDTCSKNGYCRYYY